MYVTLFAPAPWSVGALQLRCIIVFAAPYGPRCRSHNQLVTVARGSAVVVEELARCGERQRLCHNIMSHSSDDLVCPVVGEIGLGKGQQRGHELGDWRGTSWASHVVLREEGGFRRSIVPLLETVYFYDARPTEHAGEGVPTKRESQRLTVWGPAASPSEAVSARIRCSGASLVVSPVSPLPACTIQTGGSRPRCA